MRDLCNRDCFHCKYEDCIVDDVSAMERVEQIERDINTQTMPKRSKFNKCKKWQQQGGVWTG
jgi:hypothetical protein